MGNLNITIISYLYFYLSFSEITKTGVFTETFSFWICSYWRKY